MKNSELLKRQLNKWSFKHILAKHKPISYVVFSSDSEATDFQVGVLLWQWQSKQLRKCEDWTVSILSDYKGEVGNKYK